MKLWVVIDNNRWGYSHNVVRAPDEEAALKLAGARPHPTRVEAFELVPEGEPAVLWCHDESPSTGD